MVNVHYSISPLCCRRDVGTRRAAAAVATISLLPSTSEENKNHDDDEDNDEGENTTNKGVAKASEKKKLSTKKGDKKDKFEFDFSGPWVSEDLFAVPAANKRGERVTPPLYCMYSSHCTPLLSPSHPSGLLPL